LIEDLEDLSSMEIGHYGFFCAQKLRFESSWWKAGGGRGRRRGLWQLSSCL
jgi:hypothetical protein